jgi:Zn-dependent protease with chaperone function
MTNSILSVNNPSCYNKSMVINLILGGFFYFCMCNWIQIWYLLGNLIKPKKNKLTPFENKKLLLKMREKTKLSLSIKIMDEKDKMIGFMVSSPPFKPLMLFSEKLNKSFTDDEMQWVILHESGHYLMWHNLKFALSQILLFIAVIYFDLRTNVGTAVLFLLLIVSAIIYIQIAKIFEYQADTYAAENIDNPHGMITGNIKMRDANKGFLSNKIMKYVLTIAVPYEERIRIARKQLYFKKAQ